MTDTDLLKLAAKAAGLAIDFTKKKGEYFSIVGTAHHWNPGLNSQQAFELADALHLMIDMTADRVRVTAGAMDHICNVAYGPHNRMAINRLAILRVAADIQLAKENAVK